MYSTILEAYRFELLDGIAPGAEYEHRTDQLVAFKEQLRNSTPEEFNTWFELYKDAPKFSAIQRRSKRTIHTVEDQPND